MKGLESVVLPLEQSRALAEKGIVLDTAMMWVVKADRYDQLATTVIPSEDTTEEINGLEVICGAPTLSELLDAIRARDKNVEICLYGAGAIDAWSGGTPYVLTGSTDLLAAYALLLEVAK